MRRVLTFADSLACSSVSRLVYIPNYWHPLAGWQTGWLEAGMTGWLAGSGDCMIGWLVIWSVGRKIGSSWMVGRMTRRIVG